MGQKHDKAGSTGSGKTSGPFGDKPQSGEEYWPKDRKDNEDIDKAMPDRPLFVDDNDKPTEQEDA